MVPRHTRQNLNESKHGGAKVIALASVSALDAWIKTLTLTIIFKQFKIDFYYFMCVFLMTRPFDWCH